MNIVAYDGEYINIIVDYKIINKIPFKTNAYVKLIKLDNNSDNYLILSNFKYIGNSSEIKLLPQKELPKILTIDGYHHHNININNINYSIPDKGEILYYENIILIKYSSESFSIIIYDLNSKSESNRLDLPYDTPKILKTIDKKEMSEPNKNFNDDIDIIIGNTIKIKDDIIIHLVIKSKNKQNILIITINIDKLDKIHFSPINIKFAKPITNIVGTSKSLLICAKYTEWYYINKETLDINYIGKYESATLF